jgi:DNA repair exonuclease SbcCD ATPase subunit
MSEANAPTADSQEAPAPSEASFAAAEPVTAQEPTDAPEAAGTAESAPASSAANGHTGLAVDERAYQQYQALAQTVLDSADIASKSAESALAVSGQLRKATIELKALTDVGHKKARLLLIISGGVMAACTLFFLIMGVRMVGRINQLDAMVEAVGKRVIELNVAMESIEAVNRSMQELTAKQTELTKAQGQIEGRIDASLKQSESLVQKVPSETAKQVAASSDSLMKQVQGINSRLQSQANAVQSLGGEVKSLKSAVGNVDSLKRDVESLITLQKERYLEALQKNNASAAKERALQYPRVSPAKPAEAASTGANNPGPALAPAAKP